MGEGFCQRFFVIETLLFSSGVVDAQVFLDDIEVI